MNIRIKGTNTTLTPAMENIINKKMERLAKFIKEEDKVSVEAEVDPKNKQGLRFRVEIDIQPKGHYADARGRELYEALDLAIPKIKEQLAKEKDKKLSERRGARGVKGTK